MGKHIHSPLIATVCAAALILTGGCATYETTTTERTRSQTRVKHRDDRRDDRREREERREREREERRERERDERREERGERGEWNRSPSMGMTKSEVRKRYGEPVEVDRTRQGEVWYYVAKVHGRDFIPIYGAVTQRRKGGSIGFDSRGRVNAYSWGRDYRNAWWY